MRLLKQCRPAVLVWKGLKSIKQHGLRFTWSKIKGKISQRLKFGRLIKKPLFTKAELRRQKNHVFPESIRFSIVVPLFNTPERFLREMLQSVLDQTYGNWELCLADGSDAAHNNVGSICRHYAEKDQRIRYRKLEKNLGISGNTNACLEMATGNYIGLFDHDDLLHPAALYEVMRAICEGNADFIYTDEAQFTRKPEKAYQPHYKPAYAPDNLLANNYICHFTVFSRKILDIVGGFHSEYDGSQDHDFVLRATNAASCIAHIPEILYFWRCHPDSVASGAGAKPYAITAGRKAVSDHISRMGGKGIVTSTVACPTYYRIAYELEVHPKVSIIIPNSEHMHDLKKCVDSVLGKTAYPDYEIVIVENNSQSKEIFDYYKRLQTETDKIKVVIWPGSFNFPLICNYGVEKSSGQVLVFLNNDTEIITPGWIEEMLMYAQRKDVGAVGAKLYYPDDTVQHAGVLLGCGGVAGHYYPRTAKENAGYMGRLSYAQDQTAVTAACLMVQRAVFNRVGGFDQDLAITFNDIDFCMKLRKEGFLNVWTPFAELYHYESKSRGYEDTEAKKARFASEAKLFQEHWKDELNKGDPFYNPNLELDGASFTYKRTCLPHEFRYTRKEAI